MRVLITTLGRSHFIGAASSIIASGVDAVLFQGWILRNARKSVCVKIARRLLGRGDSFIYGMSKRTTPQLDEPGRNVGDFLAEAVQTVAERTLGRINRWWWNWSIKLGFRLHGWRTAHLLRRGGFDIFHVKSGLGRGGAIRAAKRLGIKVLADHGAGAPQYIIENVACATWGSWSYWWSVMEDCNEADLLMVNSDFVKSTFLRHGYPEEKIRVVYMGLDTWFSGLRRWDEDLNGLGRSREKPLRIVFSGPFAEHKGNHDFLAAIDGLLKIEGLFIEVTVLGSVKIAPSDQAQYGRVIERIRFCGHLPQDEMCEVMKSQHIYLFPSHSEGCAKSAFEAMSMGLCVVCTFETGLPMRDGFDGHLIEKRNPQSIVDKILWLVEHPDVICATGLAACETLKKYTWDYYAENVKKVYAELLENRP